MHYPQNLPKEENGPSVSAGTSPNWAGVVATSTSPRFEAVSGFWNVPTVTMPAGVTYATSSLWVGIDGWSSYTNDIIQCGTQQATYFFGFVGSGFDIAFYTPWIEYFPNTTQNVSMSVYAGDEIFSEAWAGDANGAVDWQYGHYGWFDVDDETQGTYYFGSIAQPSGTFFWGVNAEWIMERGPSTPPSLPALADFGYPIMQGAAAMAVGQGYQSMSNFNTTDVYMDSSANRQLAYGFGSGETVYYGWNAAQ
jgi:hypothetical protein